MAATRRDYKSLHHHGIVILITGSAAAEQHERFGTGVPDFVTGTGRNGDGIERTDIAQLISEFHAARSAQDIVNLLRLRMIMLLRGAAHRDGGFGEALVTNDRVAMGE